MLEAAVDSTDHANEWLSVIGAEAGSLELAKPQKPIVIAIIDDGLKLDHELLAGLIWKNPNEIAANNVDDDGNGYIDDIHGWDVADSDANVSIAPARARDDYHGTHMAGVIAQIVKSVFGGAAGDWVQILPIKAISDHASDAYLRDAYDGFEYAKNAKADIILTAWAKTELSNRENELLDRVLQDDIIVVAAAGNHQRKIAQYPAAKPQIIAVSSVDRDGHLDPSANFGSHIDVVAPGANVPSAAAHGHNQWLTKSGTSQAAAMTAAAMGILKATHPKKNNNELLACVKHGSKPFDELRKIEVANMGAGLLNIQQALRCPNLDIPTPTYQIRKAYQGYLRPMERSSQSTWVLAPKGDFKGFEFAQARPAFTSGTVRFYNQNIANPKPFSVFPLNQVPKRIFIPGTFVRVVLDDLDDKTELAPLFAYRAISKDFSIEYCQGTQYVDEPGRITDGSGALPYAMNSDCKWQVRAPEGHAVKVSAAMLDTQTGVDRILFFDGRDTQQTRLMATYTGQTPAPSFTSWSNEMLIWFVSDGESQNQGWALDVSFVPVATP